MDIAQRLLARLPPNIALTAFLDGLCQELRALSPGERESFVSSASAEGHAIDVVTAAPLAKEETDRVREALERALGTSPTFEFRTDAALIAGIELHSRNTIVRNSWRADLDRIGKELSRDERPSRS